MLKLTPAEVKAIHAVSALIVLQQQGEFAGLKTDIQLWIDSVKNAGHWPTKPDGTSFTDDDIHLAAAAARTGFQAAIDALSN